MRFSNNEVVFSSRSTVLSNSLQEFLIRNNDNLDRNEVDNISTFQRRLRRREESSLTILGTARQNYAPMSFRDRLYVSPAQGSLFSHQRNLIHHILESEEYAIVQTLGLRRSLDEMTVATDSQIRSLNGDYSETDELMRGVTEVYLHQFTDHRHPVVQIARVFNTFGNKVALYASPFDAVQNEMFEQCERENQVRELTDTTKLMEIDPHWFINLQFNRYASQNIYMRNYRQLFLSPIWKITHVAITSVFDAASKFAKRKSRIGATTTTSNTDLSEDESASDFDVIYSSTDSEAGAPRSDDEDDLRDYGGAMSEVDNTPVGIIDPDDVDETENVSENEILVDDHATATTTTRPSEEDIQFFKKLRPSLHRIYRNVEVNSIGNLPYLSEGKEARRAINHLSGDGTSSTITVRELAQLVVPRGYLNTVLLDNSGTGRHTAILSLCMFDDSRNNWIFARQYTFQRMFALLEQFPKCRYHVVVNSDGLRDFAENFDRYSNECNVIVLESALAHAKNWFREAKAHRVFYCDQRYTRRAILYGGFNYMLTWRSRFDWFADHFYSSHMTLTQHFLCVEQMYDLPPLVDKPIFYRIPFRVKDDVLSVVYNPNSKNWRKANDILKQLFNREFIRLTKDGTDNETRDNILYLQDRVKNSPCVICFGRDHDYYVTTCCRSSICLSCAESVRSTLCPTCRIQVPSLVCFMLRSDELTDSSMQFKDYLLKSQVLVYHFRQLLINSLVGERENPIKVLIVNYEPGIYRKLIAKKFGYIVYQMRKTDLHSVNNFAKDRRPSILFCPCKYLLTGLDLHVVSHVFIMEKISRREAGYLLSRVYRYPRKTPLVVRQFLPREGKSAIARIRRREVTVPAFLERSLFYPQMDAIVEMNMDSDRFA